MNVMGGGGGGQRLKVQWVWGDFASSFSGFVPTLRPVERTNIVRRWLPPSPFEKAKRFVWAHCEMSFWRPNIWKGVGQVDVRRLLVTSVPALPSFPPSSARVVGQSCPSLDCDGSCLTHMAISETICYYAVMASSSHSTETFSTLSVPWPVAPSVIRVLPCEIALTPLCTPGCN